MSLIDAKSDADLINISEVTSRKTKWPRFFLAYPVHLYSPSNGSNKDIRQDKIATMQ